MAIPSVVLINDSRAPLTFGRLREVAQALQTQVVRDFAPIWKESARVTAVAEKSDLPGGSWPIYIVDRSPGLGVHLDDNGQPYAVVQATDGWTVSASHELLEMLADPEGKRTVRGRDIDPHGDHYDVDYLVEVCDPCQVYDYPIGSIPVSDFVTPDYFQPARGEWTKLDLVGRLSAPLEVPPGCHLSWRDLGRGRWHQKEPDGSVSRDAPEKDATRDGRDRAFAELASEERHDLLAAARAMRTELIEAALDDLFSNDERMGLIIERAAETYGWGGAETDVAVREYRRHLQLRYLHPNLPVAALNKLGDGLWHQHIIDTHKYRHDCELIFGGPVEHEPFYTPSGTTDSGTHEDIEKTEQLYERAFGRMLVRLERTSSSPPP